MKEDKLIQKWIRKKAFLNRPDEMLYRSRSTDLLYTQWMSAYVLKYIHFNYHDKVLCIGCHGGKWVGDIDRTVNIKGYILDQSVRQLQYAMHLYPHFNYDISDEHLPFKERKFHKVIINQPFDSFYEHEALIQELQRVTKKKGRIILFQRKGILHPKLNLEPLLQNTILTVTQETAYKNMLIYELKRK